MAYAYSMHAMFRFPILSMLLLLCSSLSVAVHADPVGNEAGRVVSSHEAREALGYALGVVDSPYVHGADGPEAFDCSGLIMWAYWSSLGEETIFVLEGQRLADLTILELFQYGVQLVPREKVRPGDIVFIGPRQGEITHGGLVVSTDSKGVRFINASSFFGRVIVDYWSFKQPVRDQSILAYGRILYK